MENINKGSSKVLNVSLILFSFVYCLLFYKQWLLMVPLFIVGTRKETSTLIINTSIIYFFCLFTNWLNILLLSLCFCFYLLINYLIQVFIKDDYYTLLISTLFVSFVLFRIEESNFLLLLSYTLFSVAFVMIFDWIYDSYCLLFKDKKNYFLEVISIQLSADKKVNGDYFDTYEINNHQYLLLSDGMGQGEKALNISKGIIFKIKQLLQRGYNLKSSIDITNSLLYSDENAFASLDVIDIENDIAYFYKKGAENSYLWRNNQIEKISVSNLPMGIDDEKFSCVKQNVLAEDILILCSDGVMLSYPNFEEELEKKKSEDDLVKWIEKLSIKSHKKVKDDFSIILVKFMPMV